MATFTPVCHPKQHTVELQAQALKRWGPYQVVCWDTSHWENWIAGTICLNSNCNVKHAVSFYNETLERGYPRRPLPFCFSALCYPPHHSRVTFWQTLLIQSANIPFSCAKLHFSYQPPSHHPFPMEEVHRLARALCSMGTTHQHQLKELIQLWKGGFLICPHTILTA